MAPSSPPRPSRASLRVKTRGCTPILPAGPCWSPRAALLKSRPNHWTMAALLNGGLLPPGDEFLDIFAEHVRLQIHGVAHCPFPQRRHVVGVGDDPDAKTFLLHRRHRQADAIHRH